MFVEQASAFLLTLNPSLVLSPPSCEEHTGRDVCYHGPNQYGADGPILCKNLPEGQRCVVASWYLSPERHVIEYVGYVTLFLLVLYVVGPRLARFPDKQTTDTNTNTNALQPTKLQQAVCFSQFISLLAYKSMGYSGKLYFMLMPCNVLWSLGMILSFCNTTTHTSHIIIQTWLTLTMLVVMAIVNADLGDLILPFEIPYYYINHCCLLVWPLCFWVSGKVSVLPKGDRETRYSCLLRWWAWSCASFDLFYVGFVTPLSILSGLNLNYMLSPPATPGNIITGPNFRFQTLVALSSIFFFTRVVMMLVEEITRHVYHSLTIKHKKTL